MSIHKLGSDLIRPRGSAPAASQRQVQSAKKDPDSSTSPRTDRVELSQEGLKLAAEQAETSSGLDPARTATIRDRLDKGFYNESVVAETIALRLLESGDLINPS